MRPQAVGPLAEDAARLLRYFEGRQEEVLQAREIDELNPGGMGRSACVLVASVGTEDADGADPYRFSGRPRGHFMGPGWPGEPVNARNQG